MCQGDDDGAFLQKGKLVQRFRPEGPRLMPSKAPEPSAHAAFLHWRQGEVTKFSALQLYTAHDDMYLKLLFGHMQKADELGNNDGLLTEEEYPGLQELVAVLNRDVPPKRRFCAKWPLLLRRRCRKKLQKLYYYKMPPKVTIPLALNATDLKRASLKPYIEAVKSSAEASQLDCQTALEEGIRATRATQKMAMEELKPAYDSIRDAHVAAKSLGNSSGEPLLEDNTTAELEVAKLELFMLQLAREEEWLVSCTSNLPVFAADFGLNPPELVSAAGGYEENGTQVSLTGSGMARTRGNWSSLLQQTPGAGPVCVYNSAETCTRGIGQVPLLGSHNANAYSLRYDCAELKETCTEWNSVLQQTCTTFGEQCTSWTRSVRRECIEWGYECAEWSDRNCGPLSFICDAVCLVSRLVCQKYALIAEYTCRATTNVCRGFASYSSWQGCAVPLEFVCTLGTSFLARAATKCLFENQQSGITYQLDRGARVFDFDTCLRNNMLLNCHGTQDFLKAIGGSTEGDLVRIWQWLNRNPNEVVLFRWGDTDNGIEGRDYPAGADASQIHDDLRQEMLQRVFARCSSTRACSTTNLLQTFGQMVSNNQRFVILEDITRSFSFTENGAGATETDIVNYLEEYCSTRPASSGPVLLSAYSRILSAVSYQERPTKTIEPCPSGRIGSAMCPRGIEVRTRDMIPPIGICNEQNAYTVNSLLALRLRGILRTCQERGLGVAGVMVDYVNLAGAAIMDALRFAISRGPGGVPFPQPPLPDLPNSNNGRCGVNFATRCWQNGYQCCSQYGWCGGSDGHCDQSAGCQSAYGTCNQPVVTLTPPNSTNGRCGLPSGGPDFGTRCWVSGYECCSRWGWCGNSDAHCGSGCQESFGSCVSQALPISTNGQCGEGPGTRCAQGYCCSQYGWCGNSNNHCQGGCQGSYGECG